MTRSQKILGFLVVVALGLYGCSKGPMENAGTDQQPSLEAKVQRLEADFRFVSAVREQLRTKLQAAEEKQAQLQSQLDQTIAAAAAERNALHAELKARTGERDNLRTQYDGFRKNLSDLLVQAESALGNPATSPVPNIPTIPTIPAIPSSPASPAVPALLGAETIAPSPRLSLSN
jgi:outer membrane murein-binding lipoprotein Lpp